MAWVFIIVGLAAAGLAVLAGWRARDRRCDANEVSRLLALQPPNPACFSNEIISGLPEVAQRFFRFAIAPGTPLWEVAAIEMMGEFGMGDNEAPNYVPITASQVLAAPHGFIWTVSGGQGRMRFSGSDTLDWTRFWLMDLAPVARIGDDTDHRKSAFGRCIAEAVFWTPAALLPRHGVTWEGLSESHARVTIQHGGLGQAVDVTIGTDGQPLQVEFQRWSNANPENTYRHQPFGGYLSGFRDFQGFRLPTRVEGGNHFGTANYFPFFKVKITRIRFPPPILHDHLRS